MLRVVIVVVAIIALTDASCMDTIRKIQNKSGKTRLMGGFSKIEDPGKDEIVADIAAQSAKEFNQRSNDMIQFKCDEITEGYVQLVNGLRYCMQLKLSSSGCKNNINSDFCQKKVSQTCVVSASKEFNDATATIDKASLTCVVAG